MDAFHVFFAIAVGFVGTGLYEGYRRAKSGTVKSNSPIVIAFSIFLGIFLLFASVPGAFFGQPYWLADKLYWLVEKTLGLFT